MFIPHNHPGRVFFRSFHLGYVLAGKSAFINLTLPVSLA
jgi:hypothetical protein